MEWEKPSSRRVKDFALYSGRLKHIDWKAAIETGVDWKDPNFPTNGDSILDKDIPKQPAHDSWRNFLRTVLLLLNLCSHFSDDLTKII